MPLPKKKAETKSRARELAELIVVLGKEMAAHDSASEESQLFKIHWAEFGEGYISSAEIVVRKLVELDRLK